MADSHTRHNRKPEPARRAGAPDAGKPAPASRRPAQHDVLKLVGPGDRAKSGIQRFADRYGALNLVARNHGNPRT